MSRVNLEPRPALLPLPVVLVGSGSGQEKNIMTAAWAGVLSSEPPVVGVGVRPDRHTHKLISQSGEFTVNVPQPSLLEALRVAGRESGRDMDKFKALGLKAESGSVLQHAPGVGQCPIILECKVVSSVSLGSHDLFMGEVVNVSADEAILTDGAIDIGKMDLICFAQGTYLRAGDLES